MKIQKIQRLALPIRLVGGMILILSGLVAISCVLITFFLGEQALTIAIVLVIIFLIGVVPIGIGGSLIRSYYKKKPKLDKQKA